METQNKLITSNACWLKNRCNKYLTNPDAPCKQDDVFCIKLFKVNELLNTALLSDKQKERVTLVLDNDRCDEEAFNTLHDIELDIKNFVLQGNNLLIYSSHPGNGKTTWAVRLLQDYIEKIWPNSEITCKALFINVPHFFLSLKDNISNHSEYIDHIKKYVLDADLVVWDEIGTKTLTQFEFDNLLNLIDCRINKGKSNIYTSNLNCNEIKNKLGDRLASRIVKLSRVIEFKGLDKRGLVYDTAANN